MARLWQSPAAHPSTQRLREHYQQIDTLREYVLLAQDQPRIEVWRRASASEDWSQSTHGPGDVVDLPSIDCRLDVNELYAAAGIAKP